MNKDSAQREKATKMLGNGCNCNHCNQLNKMNCYKKDFLLREAANNFLVTRPLSLVATFLGGFFLRFF